MSTSPQEPGDNPAEVTPGDVTESPSEPDEDGKDSHEAPPDPAGIPDDHPSNSGEGKQP